LFSEGLVISEGVVISESGVPLINYDTSKATTGED